MGFHICRYVSKGRGNGGDGTYGRSNSLLLASLVTPFVNLEIRARLLPACYALHGDCGVECAQFLWPDGRRVAPFLVAALHFPVGGIGDGRTRGGEVLVPEIC